jgi:tetratricopeptide (TPR) repeat protein
MSRRRAAEAIVLLALLAPAAGSALRAADATVAVAFLEKARAAHARGNRRIVERLVTAERWVAYEAFYEALKVDDVAPGAITEILSSTYASAFDDRVLQDALTLARTWTPEQRARRRKTFDMRQAGRQAMRDGRLDEAGELFARALDVYHDLGDLREEAWSRSNLGAVAALRGQGRESLAHLDRAGEAGGRAGDLSLFGVVALNRAYVLEDLGETEAALAAYDKALTTSRETRDLEAETRVLASRGTLVMKSGRLEAAAADFSAAVAAGERSADFEVQAVAWVNLAAIDKLRGDTESQVRHLRRSMEVARRGGLRLAEMDASLILSRVARWRGDFDEARRRLDSCREALAGSDDAQRLHKLDMEEASLRIDQGQYSEALSYLASAERRIEGLDLGGRPAALFLSRAVALYYLGDYDGTVGQLRASLEEARRNDHPELEASARAQLGYVLYILGDAAGGLSELEEATRIEERIGDRPGRGSRLDAIGFIRYKTGDLAGARAALEEALACLPDDIGVDRAEAMKDLALVHLASGGDGRARGLELLHQAREIFTKMHDLQGVFQSNLLEADALLTNRDVDSARAALARAEAVPVGRAAREDAWLAQHLRGRLAALEGNTVEARRRYQRAVTEVESLRRTVRPAPWRAALLEDRIAPYRALVRLLRDQGDIDAAWRIARTAKARTFVESLVAPDLEPSPATAPSEEVDVLPGSWRPNPDRPRLARAVRSGAPSGAASPFEAGPATTGRLCALLQDDERLIDFFPDGPEVTAFILKRGGLSVRTLRRDEAGEALAARWPGRPEAGDAPVTAAWRHAMVRIGSELFEPLSADLAGAAHLIIVPGGALQAVPFAAVEIRGVRIVDRFRLSVLPAAEALLSRERRPAGEGTLVIGDPASEGTRLPAAAREARAIGALAGGARVLTGEAATEAAFRALAPGADRIHVAAHARIDRIAPTRTHLALAADRERDGRLEAGEVARMDLAASLVVLSGCGTGVDGGLARGDAPADERAGLTRAFLQAGAGTVIADLWEMDDVASAAIMPRLYAGRGALDPAVALADLQRDLAAGRIHGEDGIVLDHPYYWAGLLAWGAGFAPMPVRSTAPAPGPPAE